VWKVVTNLALSSKEMWDAQMRRATEAGFVTKDAETDYDKIKQSYKSEDYTVEVPNQTHIASEMDTSHYRCCSTANGCW
jgi:hypothetical protein